MMTEEFVERPAAKPVRVVTPSAASALPSAESEQRLADMEQRRDAAELAVIELEEKQGRALAEHGAEDPALEDEVVAKRSQARKLNIACDVLRADIEVAKKRERRDLIMATRADLLANHAKCDGTAKKMAATLATLCNQINEIVHYQRECVTIVNAAKRIVPVGERKGSLRALEGVMALSDPNLLPRWVAIGTREQVGNFFGSDTGGLSEPFDQIVTGNSAQVIGEFDWLLDVTPAA